MVAPSKFSQYSILCYSLTHLSQTQKVKFFYALKGRNKKLGILQTYKVTQLAKGVLMVPKDQVASVKEFLTFWKCATTEQIIYKDDKPQR